MTTPPSRVTRMVPERLKSRAVTRFQLTISEWDTRTKAFRSEAYGSPVAAALAQFFWSGLLGAALNTMEVPFLLERRTLLWSGAHFLGTAAVFSLAGWRCRWFPIRESWLCLLGLLLLLYVLKWSVRFLEWQSDVWAIRKSSGLEGADPPFSRAS